MVPERRLRGGGVVVPMTVQDDARAGGSGHGIAEQSNGSAAAPGIGAKPQGPEPALVSALGRALSASRP